ncbi:MAG: tRNA (adenosine(37)-N6)-threonylcarbamoyltransferase complex dimerization subunit type 1 TsaB [Candidatus Omnitrophica bacterium]|nr:tRNA (adenosine(37)-N6)-threonylcarbamoyltransferase complex dimerization subunit type 1 TsaB [Candidatus Omnitrophota bacterium]
MYFLSIEPSTKIFSLALSSGRRVLRYRNMTVDKVLEHSIVPAVDRLLASAGVPFKELDAFAVGLGPGSFTSLRVGLATVKAFAMATGKPVVGVSSLDVIARGVAGLACDEICVLSDARRGMVYAAIYETPALRRKTDYLLTTVENVLNHVHGCTLFTGDGVGLYRNDIVGRRQVFAAQKFWYPQAKHLAQIAFERLAAKDYDDTGRLVPLYLYPADCQVQK